MVMMNPTGHRLVRSMRPQWFFSILCRTNLNPIGRPIFKKVGKHLLKAVGTPVHVDSDAGEGAVMAAITMYLAKPFQLGERLAKIRDTKTPFTFILSERDKLVEKEILLEMIDILGGSVDSTHLLSSDGKIIRGMLLNFNL
jgi:hypothetical protein